MSFVPGPVSLIDGTSTTAEVLGFDQYGNSFSLLEGTTVAYSIDQSSIATSTANADGLTSAIAAVGIGVATLSVTVTPPNAPALTDREAITVTAAPSVLTSVKLAFGS